MDWKEAYRTAFDATARAVAGDHPPQAMHEFLVRHRLHGAKIKMIIEPRLGWVLRGPRGCLFFTELKRINIIETNTVLSGIGPESWFVSHNPGDERIALEIIGAL